MTTDTKPTVVKVQDFEYEGTCGMCGKESVRWIVTLSDGSQVGGECAKKILGWAPTAKKFSWVSGLSVAAEHVGAFHSAVLWVNESGTRGAISLNGHPQTFGPFAWIQKEYEERYIY